MQHDILNNKWTTDVAHLKEKLKQHEIKNIYWYNLCI